MGVTQTMWCKIWLVEEVFLLFAKKGRHNKKELRPTPLLFSSIARILFILEVILELNANAKLQTWKSCMLSSC